MPLEILRRLAFDSDLVGFVRDPPQVLLPPHPVTGLHLQFDAEFLRRITEYVFERGVTLGADQVDSFKDSMPTKRDLRRRSCEYVINTVGPGHTAFAAMFDWQRRCQEMGYKEGSKPVVIVIDYGDEATRNWLSELPRQYNGYPIKYRHAPAAESQFSAGSKISQGGPDFGTLGGILEDSVSHQLFGLTCAHVGGSVGTTISEVDNKGRSIGTIGKVIGATLPPVATGACNVHAEKKAGVDAALIELTANPSPAGSSSLTVRPISDVDQNDLVIFTGAKSGAVSASVAAATIWKKVKIDHQERCFADLFSVGHRQAAYVVSAVSQGGDSGSWIFEDVSPPAATTGWMGVLIAGEKQQNQSLACHGEHVFEWAKTVQPNLVLPP
jgi:hypothetical protein